MPSESRKLHPYFAGTSRPLIIAHRGFAPAGSGWVENTRDAFDAAVSAGAKFLESDCRTTLDGVVVMTHDADLSRVTGDTRAVSEVTHAELAEIFKTRGTLLTLAEALDMFPDARWNLDVKDEAGAVPAGTLVAAHSDRVLLTSFSDVFRLAALAAATGENENKRPATSAGRNTLVRLLGALALRSRSRIAKILAGIDALQVPEHSGIIRVLSPRLIAAAHAHGVEVHVWTVNDVKRMRELCGLGVDGIITDRVDLAVQALR